MIRTTSSGFGLQSGQASRTWSDRGRSGVDGCTSDMGAPLSAQAIAHPSVTRVPRCRPGRGSCSRGP
eukprot:14212365-Alexandrium_andersonii.AAC.1